MPASRPTPTPNPDSTSSAAVMHAALESAPWGIIRLAPDGTVTFLNPQAAAWWGLPVASILHKAPTDVQPALLSAELVAALATHGTDLRPDASFWLPHTQVWIRMRVAPAPDGQVWVYWDNVTVAKQAQPQSSPLLATVEVVAHVGSYEVNLSTMSIHFSDGLFHLFGEVPQSFVPTLELIDARSHPEDAAAVKEILAAAIQNKSAYHYQRRIYRTDGQLRTLEAHGNVFMNPQGEPVKLLGLVQDITERMQAQAEVLRVKEELARQATDRYHALFKVMDEGYFLAEVLFNDQEQPIDIVYLDSNPAATRILGQEFAGRRLRDINPGYEDYWYTIFGEVARTGEGQRLEQYASPTRQWYNFYVFKAGNAQRHQVAVIFQDITERKRREANKTFLAELQDAIAQLTLVSEILQTAGAKIGIYLDLATTNFLEVNPTQGHDLTVNYSWSKPGVPRTVGPLRSQDFLSPALTQATREGRNIIIENTQADSRVHGSSFASLGMHSFAGLPVHRQGEWKYFFCVSDTVPRAWQPAEIELLSEINSRLFSRIERVRAKAALRQSELKYRTLFNAMDEGFAVFRVVHNASRQDPDYRLLELNPAFEHLTGLNRDAIGKRLRDLATGPDDWWGSVSKQVIGAAETSRSEYYVASQGRWYEITNIPYGGEQFAALYDDITARKRAEEAMAANKTWLEQQVAERTKALQASTELLQSVYDTSLISMSVMQAVRDSTGAIEDFRLVSVNKELERETGRTDLVGKLYKQEYPGIVASGLFALLCTTVETGEAQQMEYFYPYEGFDKWFSCMFVKLDDGVVATNLDITERKLAEDEVRKQLVFLQQSEQVAQLGSWEYNLHTGAFTWSAGMYGLFGIPLHSTITPDMYTQAAIAQDYPVAEQLIQQLREGRGPIDTTLRIQVNKQVRTLQVRGEVTCNEQGQPMKMLGVDLDISDVVRLEAENLRIRLQQQHALFNAVLEAQETERKRIAESLHNGLGQVLYATKLQLDQLEKITPMEAWTRANNLLSSAIRQTRTLSHELVPTVLGEFGLEAALHDICRALSTRQLFFHCYTNLEEKLPQSLQVAVYRMAQELAQNVVKHAQAKEATLSLETVPGFVLLRMEDDGVGFTTSPAEATGLGLRTIRDRVKLLGGTVDLGSTPEFGTYVRIRFPHPLLFT
ncbi:PAS domain S-box protein [Hymenobacter mucosus]|uniref:Oxygen sensor histidine kinase NreB n=1 Tax=Hymenobacter mucosus TaxID=1411120 RepID=A0A238ZCY8_9BACT|nr:PAS domain S-box protein [Hymenobacter mucosus]SNR81385.1 PAS domain S-box-containing protein [Hymenobacter mucosus]